MSAYLLGTISRQLDQIAARTGQPSGVPVSQYNDLVVRFNEMSQAYANEANVSAQLRQHVEFYKRNAEVISASWDDLKAEALEIEEELRAENRRLRALLAGQVQAA